MTAIEFSRFIYFLSLCSCGFTKEKSCKLFQIFLEKMCDTLLFEARFNEKKNSLIKSTLKQPGLCFTTLDQGLIITFGAYICSVGIMQSGVTILMNLNFDSMYFYSLTISELMFSNFSCIFLNPNIFPV